MKRYSLAISCIILAVSFQAGASNYSGKIMSVLGEMDPMDLGKTLPHEHILVDFRGAKFADNPGYDHKEVLDYVLPHLKDLKNRGFDTLIECTPDYLGRDAALLREFSQESGLNILTNTGFYPIRDGRHVPEYAFTESADQLAERWIREFRNGISDTGIRPGFIKISCSDFPLPELDEKIILAAARTHLATGLTINIHTGSGKPGPMRARAGLEALRILSEEGVAAQAFIWVHAQGSAGEWPVLLKAASNGAWISFDKFNGPESIELYLGYLDKMETAGYLDQVLISHDNGWYRVGEENTPDRFKPYSHVADSLIPALVNAGWSEEKINRLFVDNPRRAFTIAVRPVND